MTPALPSSAPEAQLLQRSEISQAPPQAAARAPAASAPASEGPHIHPKPRSVIKIHLSCFRKSSSCSADLAHGAGLCPSTGAAAPLSCHPLRDHPVDIMEVTVPSHSVLTNASTESSGPPFVLQGCCDSEPAWYDLIPGPGQSLTHSQGLFSEMGEHFFLQDVNEGNSGRDTDVSEGPDGMEEEGEGDDLSQAVVPRGGCGLLGCEEYKVNDMEWDDANDDDEDVKEEGAAQGPYDDKDSLDEEFQGLSGRGRVCFCRNCTGYTHFGGVVCHSCGHNVSADSALFRGLEGLSEWWPMAVAQATFQKARLLQQHQQVVALLWDERMDQHAESEVSGGPHPERPDRLRAVMSRLVEGRLTERCVPLQCEEASVEILATVHSRNLIEYIRSVAEGSTLPWEYEGHPLSSDMYTNPSSFACARLAAGGAVKVAETVVEGKATNGAAIIRPPGHHAESNVSMGFCFFNNAAVAARAAQAKGAQRVLILDWDIHHGNGTQHIFEDDKSVLYMSLHRHDNGSFYPGTGAAQEVGQNDGEGYTVNVPWDGGGLTNGDYLGAFTHVLLPIAYEYKPDLIIVSAGFDAAEGDPVGGCCLTPECYAHMTSMLKSVAPLVMLLEGGYNLDSTAAATEACLRVLLGEQVPNLPGPHHPSWVGLSGIQRAIQVQAKYWRSLRPAAMALSHSPAVCLDDQDQQQEQQQEQPEQQKTRAGEAGNEVHRTAVLRDSSREGGRLEDGREEHGPQDSRHVSSQQALMCPSQEATAIVEVVHQPIISSEGARASASVGLVLQPGGRGGAGAGTAHGKVEKDKKQRRRESRQARSTATVQKHPHRHHHHAGNHSHTVLHAIRKRALAGFWRRHRHRVLLASGADGSTQRGLER